MHDCRSRKYAKAVLTVRCVPCSRTIAFDNHMDACNHFVSREASSDTGGPCNGLDTVANATTLASVSSAAKLAGFDTLQYTRFREHGRVKIEVVWLGENMEDAVTSAVDWPCPSASHQLSRFHGGFNATRICSCNSTADALMTRC